LPHLPRFVALRSCLQIPQRLTLADVLFLRRAKKSRLVRIPLQPLVEEATERTAEGRMRHNFQTEWSVYWERAAGPLQGALTLKQHVWFIRNHEKSLHTQDAICAARFTPRNSRREAAPTRRANSVTPNQ
jgi:hypothetical protein